ncbi:MAG: VWA domain-containing protein [Saprospiraceae bacterium]
MISFEHPQYWYLAILAAVAPMLMQGWRLWRRKALARVGGLHVESRLFGGVFEDAGFARRMAYVAAAFLLLAAAAAGPYVPDKGREAEARACDVMLVLDLSLSMLADDAKPSRIEQARYLASRLIRDLPGDRFGVVVFAGSAQILAPISTDHAFALSALMEANPEWIDLQGSNVGDAIEQAAFALQQSKERTAKAIVMLSDGEDFGSQALRSAKNAAEAGIRIFSVVTGSARGAQIPLPQGAYNQVKLDADGRPVVTKANPGLMSELAKIGDGYCAQGPGDYNALFGELKKLQRSLVIVKSEACRAYLQSWFLAPAILLFALEFFTVFFRKKQADPAL